MYLLQSVVVWGKVDVNLLSIRKKVKKKSKCAQKGTQIIN